MTDDCGIDAMSPRLSWKNLGKNVNTNKNAIKSGNKEPFESKPDCKVSVGSISPLQKYQLVS